MKPAVFTAIAWLFAATVASGEVVFRSGHSGEPDSLDPHKAMPGSATVVINDLFEGLLTLDALGRPTAGAASEWSVSDDGLEWTFRLRDGLVWSDGVPLTADDFVYAFRRMADPATAASSMAMSVDAIAGARDVLSGRAPPESIGVSAPDSRTVIVRVPRPRPYLTTVLSSPGFVPVPRHVIEEHGDAWSGPGIHVSNGAYKLDRWIPQDYVRVVRNPRFHDADSVSIDAVHYHVVDDLNTGLRRFRAGDLHAMVNFPPDKLDWLRENLPGVLRLSPSLGLMLYAFNLEQPPYDDIRVRRALSLAVDRGILTQRIVRSGDQPAYGLIPPGMNDYPGAYPDPADGLDRDQRLEAARELLAEAGYGPDNPLEASILYHTSEEHRRIAVAVSRMWKDIGVVTELINSDRQVVNARALQGDFGVVRMAWFSVYRDPTGFFNYFLPGNPANVTRYDDGGLAGAIASADASSDIATRMTDLAAVEARIMAEQPILPLYYMVSRRLVSPKVKGWLDENPTSFRPARYMSIVD